VKIFPIKFTLQFLEMNFLTLSQANKKNINSGTNIFCCSISLNLLWAYAKIRCNIPTHKYLHKFVFVTFIVWFHPRRKLLHPMRNILDLNILNQIYSSIPLCSHIPRSPCGPGWPVGPGAPGCPGGP
jgi:hypothetical protein